MIVRARSLLGGASWIDGGGLRLERGRIERVFRSGRALERARAPRERLLDLGDVVLVPGFVNAHAHLELGGLAGRLPRERGFVGWIRALIRARARLSRRDFEDAVRAGTERLLASGTTSIGDVDSTGTTSALAAGLGPRFVVYREVLDAWNAARTAPALERVRRALPRRALAREGLSPHAPYTTSDALLGRAGALAARRRLAVSVHWAETREELDWLSRGSGDMAAILPRSPHRSGLELLACAGLLNARTSLVHGNHPGRAEPERIARAKVTLVHCPGTHAFFQREPFPLERYRRAGVAVALGTDSLASNRTLDMRAETALFRRAFPQLSPEHVFAMATVHGARALGSAAPAGELVPGAPADFAAYRCGERSGRGALDELTGGGGTVSAVWVAGARAFSGARS